MRFPRQLFCPLACVGLMAIPASAHALDTSVTYSASISQGNGLTPVGTLSFELSLDFPFDACQYAYEWDDFPQQPSAIGFLDESKTLAHRSCTENSLADFPSAIFLDDTLPSFGFDAAQNLQQVFAMTLGETSQGVLNGTIQFTSATSVVNSIQIRPSP